MPQLFKRWIRITYERTVNSIAFLPAVIALLFLVVAVFMLFLDYSEVGKSIKSSLHWLSLKDASTARSIISAIVGGTISLAVFSFSMVMIVLNQAASQLSNRVLDRLIGNRFQQVVLGFYIGTIVYALFLLSTIRDLDSALYVPSLSTYLLILVTVFDIFFFIYFIHYITQSVRYETIIYRIFSQTKKKMESSCALVEEEKWEPIIKEGIRIPSPKTGLFQGFQKKELNHLCERHNLVLSFLFPVGTFLIEGSTFMIISGKKPDKHLLKEIEAQINIGKGKQIEISYYYGFRQLMEVGIKALSPGINDPGTAVVSLQVLADLLSYRMNHFPELYIKDEKGVVRIINCEKTFDEIFALSILPIWDYGKEDRLIQKEMFHVLNLLSEKGENPMVNSLLQRVKAAQKDE